MMSVIGKTATGTQTHCFNHTESQNVDLCGFDC